MRCKIVLENSVSACHKVSRQHRTQSVLKMVGLMGWVMPDQHVWRKGPWTPEEDKLLTEYITLHGEGRWSSVARCAGLNRSGKSCRLRWVNYLRPGLKRGQITPQEEGIIIELHALWGNKWSTIARYLPGRTDNEIKNYWRTHFKKKEKSARKASERRKNQNAKCKPHPKSQQQQQRKLEAPELQTDMELPAVSCIEHMNQIIALPQVNNNSKQMPSMYQGTTIEDQSNLVISASSSWMDALCQDQDSLWWGGLWNFVDQAPQQDQYCSKMALSLQNQAATTNNNIINTNNGFSWGGDQNSLYNNEGYIF